MGLQGLRSENSTCLNFFGLSRHKPDDLKKNLGLKTPWLNFEPPKKIINFFKKKSEKKLKNLKIKKRGLKSIFCQK